MLFAYEWLSSGIPLQTANARSETRELTRLSSVSDFQVSRLKTLRSSKMITTPATWIPLQIWLDPLPRTSRGTLHEDSLLPHVWEVLCADGPQLPCCNPLHRFRRLVWLHLILCLNRLRTTRTNCSRCHAHAAASSPAHLRPQRPCPYHLPQQ